VVSSDFAKIENFDSCLTNNSPQFLLTTSGIRHAKQPGYVLDAWLLARCALGELTSAQQTQLEDLLLHDEQLCPAAGGHHRAAARAASYTASSGNDTAGLTDTQPLGLAATLAA
jgi:hypothetical protein